MSAQVYEIEARFPGPVGEAYFRDRSYFAGIMGPLGSGKTNLTILKILAHASEQEPNQRGVRPVRTIAVRNTYPDLLSTTIKDWEGLTIPFGRVIQTTPPSQVSTWSLPDGTRVEHEILFIALDREDHVRKLRGVQSSILWLNECKELVKPVVDMATRGLGRYPSLALGGVRCTRKAVVADFNAPDEDHWLAKMMEASEEGYRFFIQPGAVLWDPVSMSWVENPQAENLFGLPPGYYRDLMKHKRDDWLKVNLANQLGSSVDGKPIHPEYNALLHRRGCDPVAGVPVLAGVDFGLTPAMALGQVIDGQLRIFDEIVTESFSALDLAHAAKERLGSQWHGLRIERGWGDPSGKDPAQTDKRTPFMMLQGQGLPIDPAGTNNAFALRREALGDRLRRLTSRGEPAIVVDPRCTVLNKGLAGHYQFKRLRVAGDERYHDVPDKNMYSHICEALQYLCVGLGDGYTAMAYPERHSHRTFPVKKQGVKLNGSRARR